MWIPNVDQIKSVHEELVVLFREDDDPISPPGIRSEDLLQSAASRPLTSLGGVDKYKNTLQKVAALFHSLTKNHAFHNGNKRTATVVLLTSLYRNDLRLKENVTDDVLFDFVLSVTSDKFPDEYKSFSIDEVVSEIAEWLRRHTQKLAGKSGSMKIIDFLSKCRSVGANVKKTKTGSYAVSTTFGNIRVSGSTPEISGPVVRTYLKKLGLTVSASGFDQREFEDGVSPEREQVRRYMVTLRRLAKT